jgi:putative ABC transport system substrate-binding protein
MEVNRVEKLEAAFKDAVKARSSALTVSLSAMINSNQRKIRQLAAENRLPAIYPRAEFVESGGLMSYGADRNEGFRRAAVNDRQNSERNKTCGDSRRAAKEV